MVKSVELEANRESKTVRQVELELKKVRLEAEAARLEARATELLLWLERFGRGEWTEPPVSLSLQAMQSLQAKDGSEEEQFCQQLEVAAWQRLAGSNWYQALGDSPTEELAKPAVATESNPGVPAATSNVEEEAGEVRKTETDIAIGRAEQGRAVDPQPLVARAETQVDQKQVDQKQVDSAPMKSPGVAAADPQAVVECAVECKVKTPAREQSNEKENAKVEKEVNAEKRRLEAAVVAKLGKVDATVPTDDHVPRRLQLGSAAISTVAHLVVLALLGLMTFATQQNEPRDISAMVATSSSTGEADQLETVPIEAAAAPESAASSESATSEMAVQPMAELTAATGAASLPMAASAASSGSIGDLADAFSEASQSALSGAAMSAMNGDAKSTVFCGVSTGGSRICFLVDSSRSMSKGRFEAARDELLRTIDSFSADKRFYVIFFDENPAAMSFNSSTPERYLAMATDENKRAVRTWAMTVEKEPGKAPDEALKLAFKLEPEVIFLLTDGEFPDRTEALIRQLNQRESLLGDSTHRCIVHTIAFHGKEGIERLKRIATAHKGTFRYVAPPGGNP